MSPLAVRSLPSKKKTDWWPLLRLQLLANQLPLPTAELVFHPPRRWRFDFAWREQMIALEIEGGIYVRGRHTRGAGYENDLEKYAHAIVDGWIVLRVSPSQLRDGRAVRWLAATMRGLRATAAQGPRSDADIGGWSN